MRKEAEKNQIITQISKKLKVGAGRSKLIADIREEAIRRIKSSGRAAETLRRA